MGLEDLKLEGAGVWVKGVVFATSARRPFATTKAEKENTGVARKSEPAGLNLSPRFTPSLPPQLIPLLSVALPLRFFPCLCLSPGCFFVCRG